MCIWFCQFQPYKHNTTRLDKLINLQIRIWSESFWNQTPHSVSITRFPCRIKKRHSNTNYLSQTPGHQSITHHPLPTLYIIWCRYAIHLAHSLFVECCGTRPSIIPNDKTLTGLPVVHHNHNHIEHQPLNTLDLFSRSQQKRW